MNAVSLVTAKIPGSCPNRPHCLKWKPHYSANCLTKYKQSEEGIGVGFLPPIWLWFVEFMVFRKTLDPAQYKAAFTWFPIHFHFGGWMALGCKCSIGGFHVPPLWIFCVSYAVSLPQGNSNIFQVWSQESSQDEYWILGQKMGQLQPPRPNVFPQTD